MEQRDRANRANNLTGSAGHATGSQALSDPGSWVDEHGDALFRYALLRVREPAIAEDVVQETFLAAVKEQHRFQGGSQVRTWLIGILRHKIVDHFRKHRRERQADDLGDSDSVLDGAFDSRGHWRTPPKRWDVNPAELAQRQEFWLVLQRCIEALPGRAGEAFALRVVDETGSDEVCKLLGITATNLWVLLHRARARLRGCLEVNWFGQHAEESV